MKLAIHYSKWSFSGEWIKYCKKKSIEYKIVDCYSSDIINTIDDCDVLLFHHHHTDAKDFKFAKQLLFAVEQSGKKVFPDFNTGWHFDDKLGQKYLLESLAAPLVPTYLFYSKKEAKAWIKKTKFPKIFKLRGGAGSLNVKKVSSKKVALKLVNQAFGRGFSSYSRVQNLKTNIKELIKGKNHVFELLKSFRRFILSTEFSKIHGREKGYILFQDFIPNNLFDIRVITIGDRAFAIKRMVKTNDFRASGSGIINYDPKGINIECIKIAFETTKKLKAQCVAYDFVFDELDNPLIVEINYGFAHKSYKLCPGYWDNELNWYEEEFKPTEWMIDLVLK